MANEAAGVCTKNLRPPPDYFETTDLGIGEVIHDAAGRAYDNVHAFAQHDRLGHHVNPPHQRRTAHVDPGPQRLKLLRYLCEEHRVSDAAAQ